jgi:hypothetical protein
VNYEGWRETPQRRQVRGTDLIGILSSKLEGGGRGGGLICSVKNSNFKQHALARQGLLSAQLLATVHPAALNNCLINHMSSLKISRGDPSLQRLFNNVDDNALINQLLGLLEAGRDANTAGKRPQFCESGNVVKSWRNCQSGGLIFLM